MGAAIAFVADVATQYFLADVYKWIAGFLLVVVFALILTRKKC
jgi:hypothetical protein